MRAVQPVAMSPCSVLILALLLATTACNVLPSFGKDESEKRAAGLQELHQRVMRFADEYVGRTGVPLNQLKAQAETSAERLTLQNWKVTQATSVYTIASGPNPITNALDMVVLATLSRMVVEDAWTKGHFGERAGPLLEAHRAAEDRAWSLVNKHLTEEQKQQLRDVITTWRKDNPEVSAVANIHFIDFAKAMGRPDPKSQPRGSLFALVGLDPLSNLDPAVKEIAQTRDLAERTIYYAQRVPALLDMQIERLSYQLAAMPESRQLLADAARTSEAAQRAGELAAKLPEVVAKERQAAIAQFMAAFSEQEAKTQALAVELRQTLEAGTAASDSVNSTIRSLDELMAKLGKGSAEPGVATAPGKPFDIADYTAAAREFTATSRQLEALVRSLDASVPGVAQLTQAASQEAARLVDHLFWRAAALIVLLVVSVLVAMILYRIIASRLQRTNA